jgi:hypothetical protein
VGRLRALEGTGSQLALGLRRSQANGVPPAAAPLPWRPITLPLAAPPLNPAPAPPHANAPAPQPEVGKKLIGTCFRYIPRGLVSQFLESMNSRQGLTTVDGQFRYCDPKVLQHVTTPVLGVCGDWDLFCPAPGGLRTVQHYGGEHRRFVFLGPEYGACDGGGYALAAMGWALSAAARVPQSAAGGRGGAGRHPCAASDPPLPCIPLKLLSHLPQPPSPPNPPPQAPPRTTTATLMSSWAAMRAPRCGPTSRRTSSSTTRP